MSLTDLNPAVKDYVHLQTSPPPPPPPLVWTPDLRLFFITRNLDENDRLLAQQLNFETETSGREIPILLTIPPFPPFTFPPFLSPFRPLPLPLKRGPGISLPGKFLKLYFAAGEF